jgi:hypothetical protein
MKTINYFLLLAVILSFSSCTTLVKFPVSPIVPAAEGTVKIKNDKNNNYLIEVSVNYLANPERLNPPKNHYVIWMDTQSGTTVNLGMLSSNKNNKASFKTVNSSKPYQIFITAEDNGDFSFPSDQEVFRTEILDIK